jgi:hypothetical protein
LAVDWTYKLGRVWPEYDNVRVKNMLGWQIFKHSVSMVLRNFGKALHIWAVPWVIAGVIVFGLALAFGLTFEEQPQDGALILVGLVALVVFIAAALWVAVAWHRYILLEDAPKGILPPLHQDRILAYLGKGFILFLLFLVAAAIVFGIIAALAVVIPALAVVLGVAVGLAMIVVFYRLSVILPAAALGEPLSLSRALEETRGSTGTIVVIAVCMVLLQLVLQGIVMILSFIPLVGIVVSLAVTMFTTMLGISILTTLYGYYIEKRDLS